MAEDLRKSWSWQDGERLLVNTGTLRLDLFRLLASIFASQRFYAFGYDHELMRLYVQFADSEAHRQLVDLAVSVRLLLERAAKRGWFHSSSRHCGVLLPKHDDDSRHSPLEFREACNKIIHAEVVRFDVDDSENPTERRPTVYLYGRKSKVMWKATLDLVQFARHVEHLVTLTEHHDSAV